MSGAERAGSVREEFLQGAKEGQLLLPRCVKCEAWAWPPPELCPGCGSGRWRWETASAGGVVLSVARVWRGAGEPFEEEVPYDLVLVKLSEGPEFITRSVSEGLAPGTPVDLEWGTVGDGFWPRAVPRSDR